MIEAAENILSRKKIQPSQLGDTEREGGREGGREREREHKLRVTLYDLKSVKSLFLVTSPITPAVPSLFLLCL